MFTVSLNADTLFQPPLHVLVSYGCDYSSLPLTQKGMGEPTTLNLRLFKGSLMVYSVFTVSLDADTLFQPPLHVPVHYGCDYSSLPLTKKGMGEPTTLNLRLFKGSLRVYSVFTVSLDADILFQAPLHVLVIYVCDYSSLPLTKKVVGKPTTLNRRLLKGSLMVYSVFTVSLDAETLFQSPLHVPVHYVCDYSSLPLTKKVVGKPTTLNLRLFKRSLMISWVLLASTLRCAVLSCCVICSCMS